MTASADSSPESRASRPVATMALANGSSPAAVPNELLSPPAFNADVTPTMDAGVAALSISSPASIPEPIPEMAEAKVFQMADGRFYNPSTGVSGASRDEVLGLAPDSSTSSASDGSQTQQQSGAASETSSNVQDDVTATIQSLFPESESLVTQYQDLRRTSGIEADEAALAKVNQEIADLNAVIENIEYEVRAQAGGMADESFIQATIADRMRRLMPRINQVNARQAALSSQIENKKANITEQIGLSRADLERAQADRKTTRDGIFEMLNLFGSQAFAGTDPKILAELEKRAGLPLGSITAQAKTLDEAAKPQFDFEFRGNKLYRLNRVTGVPEDTGMNVPEEQKSAFEQAIEVAKVLGGVSDPNQVLSFIQNYAGGGAAATGGQASSAMAGMKVSQLSDEQLSDVLMAMAKREGFGAADKTNRPNRNNNPLNIKVPAKGIEEARRRYSDPGATIDPVPATDGGQFIKFSSPEKGLEAAELLLRSNVYSDLDLNSALRKWSGNGYGAEILGGGAQQGISGNPFQKPGAVPKVSAKAPSDLADLASRVSANPRLDEKDRAAFMNDFNRLVESGNSKGAYNAVKDMAVKALPTGMQNEFVDYNTGDKRIEGLLSRIDAFKKTDTNLYKTILERGKTLSSASKDKKWLELVSTVESLQAEIRKTFFGTAVTIRESSTGQNMFVDTSKDTISDMEIKLKNLQSMANDEMKGYINYALGDF